MKSIYVYNCEVLRVVDGDTIFVAIDVGFHTTIKDFVRLYDVDTPESYGKLAEPAGKEATHFTTLWLKALDHMPEAPQQLIDTTPFIKGLVLDSRKYDAREKYGRCLGDIYRPGDTTTLSQALVRAGHVK